MFRIMVPKMKNTQRLTRKSLLDWIIKTTARSVWNVTTYLMPNNWKTYVMLVRKSAFYAKSLILPDIHVSNARVSLASVALAINKCIGILYTQMLLEKISCQSSMEETCSEITQSSTISKESMSGIQSKAVSIKNPFLHQSHGSKIFNHKSTALSNQKLIFLKARNHKRLLQWQLCFLISL